MYKKLLDSSILIFSTKGSGLYACKRTPVSIHLVNHKRAKNKNSKTCST